MTKKYIKPTMRVVEIKNRCQILTGSGAKVNSISTNMIDEDDFYYYDGGSNTEGR